jgi:peptidoglycan hydrolase-like protein with peptidoglycan-binding domain
VRRRALAAGAIGALLVAAGVAVVLDRGSGPAAGSQAPHPAAPATAVVERRDLVSSQDVDGTLGWGDTISLAGARAGTYTALPTAGDVLRRGQVIYRVDTQPVVLMYGTLPVWRTLSEGVTDGRDVRQLEQNLRALGYDPNHDMTIDEHFDWATRAAVERWQRALHVDDTGVVSPSDVVFEPGPRRVTKVMPQLGTRAAPGAPLLELSGTSRVVDVALDVASQQAAQVGKHVTVTLPDQSTVRGVISDVGKVATTSSDQNGGSSTTIDVTVALPASDHVGRLDQAPVTVTLVTASSRNVLAVPVTALAALGNGGFGVDVVRGATPGYHRVTPGTYAGSWVEISGAGIRPGVVVAVSQ